MEEWIEDGYGQEPLGCRVDIIKRCLLGKSRNDDAGGGDVASRCLGRLVVWRQLAAYR